MKKILSSCLLLCSFVTYAEETHELPPITGTWPSSNFSSLSSGIVQPQLPNNLSGMNFGPGYYEAMAQKAVAEKKAGQIRSCMEAALTRNNNNYEDVAERLALQGGDCQRELSHVPEAMAACIKQANGHFEEASKGLDAQLEVDKAWCIKAYGS